MFFEPVGLNQLMSTWYVLFQKTVTCSKSTLENPRKSCQICLKLTSETLKR